MPNYITIVIGVILANVIMIFGIAFPAILTNHSENLPKNMLCEYQYILKMPTPSENESADISQEDLVVASLRFNPDIIVVGEMRDTEAYAAVEASLTGHTVVSTILPITSPVFFYLLICSNIFLNFKENYHLYCTIFWDCFQFFF